MADPMTSTDKKQPSRLWLIVGAGAFALGLFTFIIAGTSGGAPETATDSSATRSVPLVEMEYINTAARAYTVRAPGRLQPLQTLQVVGEVPGKIAYLNPELVVGGRLSAGDILFRVDQGDYRADLERAEAQLATSLAALERARADRDRQVELAAIGAVPAAVGEASVAGFANAEAAVTQARAQVTLATRNLDKTTVRTPFDAIVTAENLASDTYVAPGAPLAELIDASAGEIRAGLSPKDVAAVRRARQTAGEGDLTVYAVPNEASIGTRRLVGRLDSFAPAIDPTSRTVAVRAVFPGAFSPENEGEVFAGDFMTLELEGQAETPAYEVPTAALRRNSSIWLIDANNALVPVTITPLENHGLTTLVTSPVDLSGQRVMTTPLADEVDGMRVRPVETNTASAQ